MSTTPDLQLGRIRGCILGGALGDAIGLFTEFLSPERCSKIYRAYPPATLPRFTLALSPPPGTHPIFQDRHRARFDHAGWTDDTDQSLLILLSFLRSFATSTPGILDQLDFAIRLKNWTTSGLRALDRLPIGLGRTVGGTVHDECYADDPVGTARRLWERTDCNAAANGAVMRTAVIGCLLFPDSGDRSGIERTMSAAVDIAATTHADPRCLISCAIVSGTVAAIMRDSSLFTLSSLHSIISAAKAMLATHDPPLSDPHLHELDEMLWVKRVEDLGLAEMTSIGYTYKCLGAGIWALRKAIDESPARPEEGALLFERLITELTMQGGDADTNCAVAGSLVGCFLTSAGLPRHWTESLAHSDWLLHKSDAVASLLSIYPRADLISPPPTYTFDCPYDPHGDVDTLLDAGKGMMGNVELDARVFFLMREAEQKIARETRGQASSQSREKVRGSQCNKGCLLA